MVSSTYFGGPYYEGAYAATVDPEGNIYFVGGTDSSTNFPIRNALQGSIGGKGDAFVSKVSPSGEVLFSTYLGGSGDDAGNSIALAPDGGIIIGGYTRSVDFPSTDDALQLDYAGGTAFGWGDGFVAKLSNDGQNLLYATYFGGTGDEAINAIAVDGEGNVFISGSTDSKNLPRKSALQSAYGGGDRDVFVAKFDPSLHNLVFSTYIGGSGSDENPNLALDTAGAAYISGDTFSTNFPVTPASFQTGHVSVTNIKTGSMDGFISKIKPDGSALVYSSYFMPGTAIYAVAIGTNGSAYITGETHVGFSDATIPLGFQPKPSEGKSDAFVARLEPDGSRVGWFSYLGGGGGDYAYAIALDRTGDVYVTGTTDSTDFPVRNAIQSTFQGGPGDAFLSRVSSDGQKLVYSTYLGGRNEDWGYGITFDKEGNAVAVGQTNSRNFPVKDPFQSTYAGSAGSMDSDAFVTRVSRAIQGPSLQISFAQPNIIVTWPDSSEGFALEEGTLDAERIEWRNISARPIVLGGQNAVFLPTSPGAHFYRLASSPVNHPL